MTVVPDWRVVYGRCQTLAYVTVSYCNERLVTTNVEGTSLTKSAIRACDAEIGVRFLARSTVTPCARLEVLDIALFRVRFGPTAVISIAVDFRAAHAQGHFPLDRVRRQLKMACPPSQSP
jgi:hypothetical protein